jgi:hypothetical protein
MVVLLLVNNGFILVLLGGLPLGPLGGPRRGRQRVQVVLVLVLVRHEHVQVRVVVAGLRVRQRL